MSATPEPLPPSSASGNAHPPPPLTRLQQLTLNTWRHAYAKVLREVRPSDTLAQTAIRTVVAILHDTTDPLALFVRHAAPAADFALVASLAAPERSRDELHDLLDSAFLLRWLELTADGGPEELPPLRRGPRPLFP